MNIKQELVRHYHWLRQYNINDSHCGNASVREGNTIWITPTGACADTLTENDLVACELSGIIGKNASLDAPLHLQVFQTNPDTLAVMHSHGPHSVAMTLNGEDFIPMDFEGQYYFPKIPVVNIDYQRYLEESPEKVAAVLAEYPIMVVRGHGVYAQATSINLAYKWTCSFELSAKTAFLAQQAGTLD